jgi:hypothetical protein
LAKPDVRMDHHPSTRTQTRPIDASAPAMLV